MDVRCDRCQTEYELDDESVTEGGASVQCTTCGHTFVVGPDGVTIAQIVPTPPGGLNDLMGPQAADWLLATEDGQTHRFRDLTTLQKWVVERKATREDRVSQRGGPWRPLAEVSELAPFFEVVEQADRARSGPGGGRRSAPRPGERLGDDGLSARQTPTRQTTVERPGSTRGRANGYGRGGGSLSARLDSAPVPTLETDALESDGAGDDGHFETMAIFRTQRGLRIAGIAGFVGLAVVAALIGFSRPRWLPFFKSSEPAPVAAPAAGKTAPAAAPAAGARPPVGAPPPASAPAAAARAAAPVIDPIPVPKPAPTPAAAPVAPPAATPVAAPAPTAGRARTYERLVADADRLMENGAPGRAQKLLDEALALQPNGVAAISGSAYLLLDRQRPMGAISMFKRALGISPEFPPALFGLAEAYRAQGELPAAAENYRKYLAVAPTGPDAPAARRQLRELESLIPKRPPPVEAPKEKYQEPAAE